MRTNPQQNVARQLLHFSLLVTRQDVSTLKSIDHSIDGTANPVLPAFDRVSEIMKRQDDKSGAVLLSAMATSRIPKVASSIDDSGQEAGQAESAVRCATQPWEA